MDNVKKPTHPDEANNTQVEPGTCLQKLVGSVRTGVILKDVSLEVLLINDIKNSFGDETTRCTGVS